MKIKQIVESILLVATIGGGFLGVESTLRRFALSEHASLNMYIFLILGVALYGYILLAGLRFALNKTNIAPLKRAFLIQIPWISSPYIVYRLAAGFNFCAIAHTDRAGNLLSIFSSGTIFMSSGLGDAFQYGLLNHAPWGIGVNYGAIILFILASRLSRKHQPNTLATSN
ncbi:hypothetical protein [Vibrio marisflavi]|uniref:Uncharacterized protein n=1 Tax=Vibrio marisflavi CECT 7928 TaxID=634439 RepID=A0ABN8E8R8_9VIBR|nr:hypothetical protein [Vibrio marisflavi]CAH0542932.1 hypothetical protein VMF7928_04310 [Vibrio marisflavi CECT 7928]